MSHGAKRHRGGSRRDRADHSGAAIPARVDEALFQANHEAAAVLRRRILVQLDAEGCTLGPCQFRQIATFKQLDLAPVPPRQHGAPSDGGCPWCVASRQRNLHISQSDTAFLALEHWRQAVLFDHLVLAPKQHVQNTLYLDDDAYTELRNYQKTLVRMYDQQGKAVVFVEVSLGDPFLRNKEDGGARQGPHCRIECFPLPADALGEAKSMFRRALSELVPDWAQSRRLLAINGNTGVRGRVPRGFDFVHVDYALDGEGLVCIVEDHDRASHSLAREVVAGVLRMDAMQRAFRSAEKHAEASSWLTSTYRNFDWTNIT
ncbi:CwfJ family protein [Babesia caballi]|uniref:CwfJ family protein n=1 Tax=Babesia caballi TaxID=5871 RepID=A0AAV4LL51_BABCB|nr:CwfJ family protein [Babesia caballi]